MSLPTLTSVTSYLSSFIPSPSLSFLSNSNGLIPPYLNFSSLPIFGGQNEDEHRDHLGRFLRVLSAEPLDESSFTFFAKYLTWTYPDAKIDFLPPKVNRSPDKEINAFLLKKKDQLNELIENDVLIYPYLQGPTCVALIVLFRGTVYYLDPLESTLPGEGVLGKLETINEKISSSYDEKEDKNPSIDLNLISKDDDDYETVSSLKKVLTTRDSTTRVDRAHSPFYALFILEEIYKGTSVDLISFKDFNMIEYKKDLHKRLEVLKHKIPNRPSFERVITAWGDSLVEQRNQKGQEFLKKETEILGKIESAESEYTRAEIDYRKSLYQSDRKNAEEKFDRASKALINLSKELTQHRQKHIDEVFHLSLEIKKAREKILSCAWDGSPSLDLRNCSLSTLPGCLHQLTELKQLDISGNPLSQLTRQSLDQLKKDLPNLVIKT